MNRVRTQIGIDNSRKYCGRNVVVGVLDSGVSMHPDLKNSIISFVDFLDGKTSPYDGYGHGTHVCGIIAGKGLESGGIYRGIAPEAKLAVGKILDDAGNGERQDLLRGLNWMIEMTEDIPIRVLNISFSFSKRRDDYYEQSILSKLQRLYDKGVLIVCAAGNNGPQNGSLSNIALSEYVLTVGCNDGPYYKEHKNRCEFYSGTGECGSLQSKPDLVAPGTEVVSCSHQYEKTGIYYTAKSGTSMATAIVSGAAAVVFEKHPEFLPAECGEYLKEHAVDLHLPFCKQGYGMVNLLKIEK